LEPRMTVAAQPVRCLAPDCGRTLTAKASVKVGYGPRCAARIRAAEAAVARDFSRAQARAALALIAAGSVTATARAGTYLVTGSDGVTVYLATWDSCGCAAARHGRLCKHVAAVRMVSAAMAPARKAA
jgi:uncharacterized Zn finger protein